MIKDEYLCPTKLVKLISKDADFIEYYFELSVKVRTILCNGFT